MAPTAKREKSSVDIFHTISNVIGVVLCVIFIPMIIMNVALIIRSYTKPDELPSVFGVAPVVVLSGSMSPEFETGDMIFVKKTDPDDLKVDDVICFFSGGPDTVITHRIVDIQQRDGERFFVTKGDYNSVEDTSAVTDEMIQGKYIEKSRIGGLGYLAEKLSSTTGMLLCIGGPLVLIFLWDILRRVLSSRKEKAQARAESERARAMEEELERLRAQVAEQEGTPMEHDDDRL